VPQKGSRHSRGKKRGAVAGPSADGACSTDHQLVPFRGFSRKYVKEHLKRTKEAIRRKEIIISLLQSGSLTERQLKAILPSCEAN